MIQPTPSRSRRVVLSMSAQVHAGQALSSQLAPLPLPHEKSLPCIAA